MPLWAVIEILVASAGLPSAPAQDCHSIPDPQARLACYDARDGGAVTQPAPRSPTAAAVPPAGTVPAAAAAAVGVPTAPPTASGMASAPSATAAVTVTRAATDAEIVRSDPTGRIAAIAPLHYGLYRIQLDDGRQFDTTSNMSAPPEVGEAVSLRRTAIGTTFLDVRGRSPITVRLQRQVR